MHATFNSSRRILSYSLCILVCFAGCTSASAQPPLQPMAATITKLALAQPAGSNNPFDYFDGLRYESTLPSPTDVLGYPIGERFSYHHDVVRYAKAVAAASDRVNIAQYGTTHEGRSLHTIFITSPANHARLDEILASNRALSEPGTTDAQAQRIIDNNPAIVGVCATRRLQQPL